MSSESHVAEAAKTVVDAQPSSKRSATEDIKEKSCHLRGSIAAELLAESDCFAEQNKQLLKFHGTYQQEDRDARKARKKEGVGKHYMFMVRCKIPGGLLTSDQYLAMDDIASAYGNNTLRFTTRQGIQLHGVLKSHLKETIAQINQCLLTTLGACGDVERNVMACPAPHYHQGVHAQLQETAAILAAHLAPRTRGYHEIWLNGNRVNQESKTEAPQEIEPLYGKVYLPRKFKTGLALPEDNCIDVYAQDLGLLAIVENGAIIGYNVLVGGGMGMTHGNQNTFPHLARPICFAPANAVVSVAEAVVKLFRDHGNRADRKRARIKYLVHDWGVEKFQNVLAEYVGGTLHPPRVVEVTGFDPHLGWHSQGYSKWYYGISVENGRVKDEGSMRLRTGLRSLVERFKPSIRLTPLQDLLLCDLESSAKADIERTLAEFGVLRPDQISTVQKFSMACPAIPTCGLAITESERVLPQLIDNLEKELKRLGLEEEKLSVRMTGCPNGCARPYQSDIGLVGRSGDKVTLFVGGNIIGNRLNFMLKDLVPFGELMPLLLTLLEHFKGARQPGESFGDYCYRMGAERLQDLLPRDAEKKTQSSAGRLGSEKISNGTPEAAPAGDGDPILNKRVNGAGHLTENVETKSGSIPLAQIQQEKHRAGTALVEPVTKSVSLAFSEPGVSLSSGVAVQPVKRIETILAGIAGEERPDYAFRFNSDHSVRETMVYFYGNDSRASSAKASDPLRREASYLGQVNPFRLHAARKLSDTIYVGAADHERRDLRIEYAADGAVTQTVIFYYEGDVRAHDAASGTPARRQVIFDGLVKN